MIRNNFRLRAERAVIPTVVATAAKKEDRSRNGIILSVASRNPENVKEMHIRS